MRHCPQSQASSARPAERGYILITLVLFVALLAISLTVMAPYMTQQIKRDREEELIHRGTQYSRAIKHYMKKFNSYPTTIEALEKTNEIRYLRRRYKDPVTGKDFKLLHLGEVQMSSTAGLAGATSAATLAAGAAALAGGGATAFGGSGVFGGNSGGAFGGNSGGAFGGNSGGFGGGSFGGNSGGAFGGNSGSSFGSNSGSGFGNSGGAFGGNNGSSFGSNSGGFGGGFGQTSSSSAGSAGTDQTQGSSGTQGGFGQPIQNLPGSNQQGTNQPGSNQPGSNNQVFGGGPIVGVASISKDKSIRVFNKKDHYKDWQFIYDPTSDRGGLITTPYQTVQVGGQNLNGTPGTSGTPAANGAPGGSGSPFGFGGQQNSGFGGQNSGFGGGPQGFGGGLNQQPQSPQPNQSPQ
jgi:type II secretory pathway pseudopilin PulG